MSDNLLGVIPPNQWNDLVDLVLAEIRAEKGIPNWEPKFHNGRREFEQAMLAKFNEHKQD